MIRLPKFLLYVYELPNAFVGRISQEEAILQSRPQEQHLTSLHPFLNRKTRRALEIAVDFAGVYSFQGIKVLRNGLWTNFQLYKIWDLTFQTIRMSVRRKFGTPLSLWRFSLESEFKPRSSQCWRNVRWTYDGLFKFLSTICHQAQIDQPVAGLSEGL